MNDFKKPFNPKPATTVLAELRSNPEYIFKNFGILVRRDTNVVLPTPTNTHSINTSADTDIGGRCQIECSYLNDIYQLKVKIGDDYNDWYIPFKDKQALYCDIPKGMPNGTLIVTAPMNGCALEVHGSESKNRFYHDSNGKSMPEVVPDSWKPKFRVDADVYEGKNAPTRTMGEKNNSPDSYEKDIHIAFNWEHSIIFIKRGEYWFIYQTGVYTSKNWVTSDFKYKKVSGPPIWLGQFLDDENFPVFNRPRSHSEFFSTNSRPRSDSEFFAPNTRPRSNSEFFNPNTRPRSNSELFTSNTRQRSDSELFAPNTRPRRDAES